MELSIAAAQARRDFTWLSVPKRLRGYCRFCRQNQDTSAAFTPLHVQTKWAHRSHYPQFVISRVKGRQPQASLKLQRKLSRYQLLTLL